MKELYLDAVAMIERLHRLSLDVVKNELDKLAIHDINNVQSLVLYNIGKGQVSVSELTNRGYYLGSNVSYNLRKMVQNGYIDQEPSPHDRRSTIIRLSEKGFDLYRKLDVAMQRHVESLLDKELSSTQFEHMVQFLGRVEHFWRSLLQHNMSFR